MKREEKEARVLDVAIATCRPEGIRRVAAMGLPRVAGVRYVVSWQEPGENPDIPESLACREDVEIHALKGLGLSANRNNALRHCRGEIVLTADDDLRYEAEDLKRVIEAFAKRPKMDLAQFRFYGSPWPWPEKESVLGRRLPKGLPVISFCQAFRRKSVEGLRYDEQFGLGAAVWQAGEEDVFLHDARRRGLECRYIPEYIVRHEHPSTGERPATPGVAAAYGKCIAMEYPLTCILRIPLKAWRESRKGGSFLNILCHAVRGAVKRRKRRD